MSLAEFAKAAGQMSRNPLGIVALFITLIYGMASFVFVQPGCQADVRAPFVWFLVLFPLVVLIVFGWLVACHHTKLYAPSDFKDESNFVSLQSPDVQRQRLEEDAEESRPTPDEANRADPKPEAATAGSTEPELHQSRQAGTGSRARYLLGEELVLRKLEVEWKVPIRRQVKVGRVEVDGLAMFPDEVRLVEVKVIKSRSSMLRVARLAAFQAQRALREMEVTGRRASYVIAIVVAGPMAFPRSLEAELARTLRGNGLGESLACRVFTFEELAREFGIR